MGKETDRRLEELGKETDRRLEKLGKETDRRIGALGNSLGDVTENLMSPNLHKKFEPLGFAFTRYTRNIKFKDHKRNQLAEVDVLLENGEYAMAVEVKTRLKTEDVKDHLKRMEILRRAADERNDKRKYLGAVAATAFNKGAEAYALKAGFYVIVPSGKTVDIEAPDAAALRIW
jgi:hypothetical protein